MILEYHHRHFTCCAVPSPSTEKSPLWDLSWLIPRHHGNSCFCGACCCQILSPQLISPIVIGSGLPPLLLHKQRASWILCSYIRKLSLPRCCSRQQEAGKVAGLPHQASTEKLLTACRLKRYSERYTPIPSSTLPDHRVSRS